MPAKPLTKEEALLKMASLCARSEQCAFDIERKLRSRGLSDGEVAQVIGELRDRKFLDDYRFARSFTNDKVRFSAWGRMKIRMALFAKRIPESAIRAASDEIDPAEYADALKRAARAKSAALDLKIREDRAKLYRHLLSRGFESDLIFKTLAHKDPGSR